MTNESAAQKSGFGGAFQAMIDSAAERAAAKVLANLLGINVDEALQKAVVHALPSAAAPAPAQAPSQERTTTARRLRKPKMNRNPKLTICPFPGCKGEAAPRWGQVCKDHYSQPDEKKAMVRTIARQPGGVWSDERAPRVTRRARAKTKRRASVKKGGKKSASKGASSHPKATKKKVAKTTPPAQTQSPQESPPANPAQ